MSKQRSVINVLSEPTAISADMEIVVDEIADIVCDNTYKVHTDDGDSTIVQFRSVQKA